MTTEELWSTTEAVAYSMRSDFDAMAEYEEIDVEVYSDYDKIEFVSDYCELEFRVRNENNHFHFNKLIIKPNPPKVSNLYDIAYSIKLFYEVLERYEGLEVEETVGVE